MPTYSVNKKARHDYEILETYEAGLVLSGAEVKSIRTGHAHLKGAYITFHGEEANLLNAHIAHYPFAAGRENYDPTRSRKLLLGKKELRYLRGKIMEKGLTIVPISLYTKGRYLKIEIALVRGKKQYDRRRDIKEKELRRETDRVMKEKT